MYDVRFTDSRPAKVTQYVVTAMLNNVRVYVSDYDAISGYVEWDRWLGRAKRFGSLQSARGITMTFGGVIRRITTSNVE